MCHQEPLPASYAQAFACLWDLVSPQHTHEPRYAMTPHFTPLELEFIPYAGGAWGIPSGCSPRARQPACSPGFFFLFDCGQKPLLWHSVAPRANSLGFCRGARGAVGAV